MIRQHPSEGTTTQQVQMHVKDLLATVGTAVQDQSVPRLVDPFFFSETGRHPDHAAESRLIGIGHVSEGWNRFVGNNQNVGRSLGLDVPERRYQLILIDEIGGHFPSDYLSENRVHSS
jgi:hypothetical protein